MGALIVVSVLLVLGIPLTHPSSAGQVEIGTLWMNYTYATSPPANDPEPLNEFYQNVVTVGTAGAGFGVLMSPYDNSSVSCTLWSVSVLAPFALVSVVVLDEPGVGPVDRLLPVTLPAAENGTSEFADLLVTIELPAHPGSYNLNLQGAATCA